MSATSLSSKTLACGCAVPMAPMTWPSRTIGVKRHGVEAELARQRPGLPAALPRSSSAMNCRVCRDSMTRPPMFASSSGRGNFSASLSKPTLPPTAGISIRPSRNSCTAANCAPNSRSRLCDDGIEHRLRVGWRAADDLAGSRRSRSAAPAPPCVSLNSRAFWIAITAWSAKVCSIRASASVNGRRSRRNTMIEPMPRPSLIIGASTSDQLKPSWRA